MPSAKATVDPNLRPDELWEVIGGFGSLPDWTPEVRQSRLADGGRVRYLHDQLGRTFVEKLERYDAAARTYSYSIVESPIAVSDYLATITVTPINGGSKSHVECRPDLRLPESASNRPARLLRGFSRRG